MGRTVEDSPKICSYRPMYCTTGCYKGNEVIGKIRAFQFQLNRENAEDFIKAFRPNQRLHSFDDITVEVWI